MALTTGSLSASMKMNNSVNRYLEWIILTAIVAIAVTLRLLPFMDFNSGSITFTGTCGQLIDEVKPLFDSNDLLNFQYFYYPTVGPLIVASTAKIVKVLLPQTFDISLHCLFVTIAFSIGTLVILYLVARRWGQYVGFTATAFFAVTMIAVDCANTVQVYETFFAMLAILYFLRSLDLPTFLNLALMGSFLGLSVASKYFSLALVPMFLLAQVCVVGTHKSFKRENEAWPGNNHRTASHSAWTIVVFAAFSITALALYVILAHRNFVFDVLKDIYDARLHEHPFEFHLNTVNRYYKFGILGLASCAAAIGAAICAPILRGMDQWDWFRQFCYRNRFWLIPSCAMAGTLFFVLGVPVAFNLNDFVRYSAWVSRAYATGDGGMFPAGHPAPSYFFSYFPESLGVPLFFLACGGILLCIYTQERKAMILIALVLPMYLILEQGSVKVNRYALDIIPVLCLFASLALKWVSSLSPPRLFKSLTSIAFTTVFIYSAVYSLAWANFERTHIAIPARAEAWIRSQIPVGSEIGMKSTLWIEGSPHLIPEPAKLKDYKIVGYRELPQYVVLPQLLYDIGSQYEALHGSGYNYTADDWFPQLPPAQEEIEVLLGLIHEEGYSLVKSFEEFPSFAGITFGSEVFGGKTWLLEHAGPYGLRIYKRKKAEDSRVSSRLDSYAVRKL